MDELAVDCSKVGSVERFDGTSMDFHWDHSCIEKRRAALIGIRKFAPSKTPKIVYT